MGVQQVTPPSLHEIAAMPFPASQEAMRQFYVKDWGKPVPDGAELRTFKVRVEYSVCSVDSRTVEVQAFTDEEAEELASDLVAEEEFGGVDFEVRHAEVVKARGQ